VSKFRIGRISPDGTFLMTTPTKFLSYECDMVTSHPAFRSYGTVVVVLEATFPWRNVKSRYSTVADNPGA